MVKNPPANGGDTRDMGSIPRSGRSPGGGHDNPLQRSLMGYSPWGLKESDTPERTHTHTHTHTHTQNPWTAQHQV